jgi:hypothetical protein
MLLQGYEETEKQANVGCVRRYWKACSRHRGASDILKLPRQHDSAAEATTAEKIHEAIDRVEISSMDRIAR